MTADIPNNLPLQLSSFIGRERELTEVTHLLSTSRLVTLIGAGGCGKTRLALQVAAECCGSSSANYSYADGVWLVEFAPLSDPALVPQRLVSALDVPEQPSQPLLTTLANFLRDMHTLLLLDNCEHLIAACAQLAETLLQRCAHVRILATSREALRVTGEIIFLVPSLAAPDPSRLPSLETLGQYEAVRLFAERARAGQPTFALTQENMASVAQICHRLDGMPLALELAAARVRASSAKQIAERLDHACQLLTGGSRTALPRHQTLRAAIGWSYDLLPEAERVLCRRLSVFAGGWTLEAAAAVCGGPDIEAAEALDLLEQLVSKSLILVDHTGNGVRYRMLETIRQYSGEKLQESGEADQVRRRHLSFCVNCAEQAEPMLGSAQRAEWLSRLRVEHDNLRAALGWACTCEPEAACWLAGLLRWFWHMNERDDEAHAWYGRVLGLARQRTPTRGLALALLGAGMISGLLLDLEEAQGLLEQSMGLWQVLGDRARLAETLFHLGRARVLLGHAEDACVIFESHAALIRQYADPIILANILTWWGRALVTTRRDYAGAMALHEQSLSIGRSIEDPITLGMSYRFMGFCAIEQADYEAAERFNQEALTWRRRTSTRLIAMSLLHSADVACLRGNYPQAQALYDDALATCRALGLQGWVAHVLARLGYLALHQGDTAGAVTHLSEALRLCRERGDRSGIARCLAGCAELRRQQGHIEQCVRLLASDALAPVLQDVRGPVDHIEYERTAAAARAQLDEARFAGLWAEGSAMTLDHTIAEAERVTPTGTAVPSSNTATPADSTGLSARESEVLRLVSAGLSDAQIAERLVISRRTISTHLTAIYGKLGVHSRSDAILYAQRHKLA